MKSMHTFKSYWAETNKKKKKKKKKKKTKSKKGHITNIEIDLYFTVIKSSAKFEWNQCIPSNVVERKRIV